MRHEIAWWLRSRPMLRRAVYGPLYHLRGRTVGRGAARAFAELWARRHEEVVGCPDNEHIPRVADAGVVRGDVQTMHNGVRIKTGSYYGDEVTRMLERNRGVHEPQEERVFGAVLGRLRERPTMLELGAYWGFYSLWFLKERPGGRAILVEPESENLTQGQENFALNGASGEFLQGFVGAAPGRSFVGRRTVSVDELMDEYRIEQLDVLHSDIQGSEMQMLDGARRTLEAGRVDYVFISTHSPELHDACRERLKSFGLVLLADASMEDTYSLDGLLAARRPPLPGPEPIEIALKRRDGVRPRAG